MIYWKIRKRYENPLEIVLRNHTRNVSVLESERYPISQRVEVFECSCCPPNINRVLASMEKYIYHMSDNILYVDQYMDSEFSNDKIQIIQKTNYPVCGNINMDVRGVELLAVRIPFWCKNFKINCEYTLKDGYAHIKNPAMVEIEFEMIARLYSANVEVNQCANKVALMYGPVAYCAESVNNNNVNLFKVYLSKELNAKVTYDDETKLNAIKVDGFVKVDKDELYYELNDCFEKIEINLNPYYSFANHGESDMRVWMNYR